MNTSIENIVCAEFTKKEVFELLIVGGGSPTCRRQGRQKVSIPECDLTGRRSTVTVPPLKIAILMLVCQCPCTPLKIGLPKFKTTVNLKSAPFVIIMHLHDGLTHIQSQIKPWLHFGESLTLTDLL